MKKPRKLKLPYQVLVKMGKRKPRFIATDWSGFDFGSMFLTPNIEGLFK